MTKLKTLELIPSARRLITSLRDVGYDHVHAVADLIDNSVAARATEISVDLHFNGASSWIRISDNGCGMSGAAITEAMRFGSERHYEKDDLGKFGLGLKTASLSQCCRVTVASRVDPARRIEVRQWDIDHVGNTNRWEVIDVSPTDRPDCLVAPLRDARGTVVLWEKLDRILGYRSPWGERARAGLLKITDELYQHLAMVFHRFIAGEAGRRNKLRLSVNGNRVAAWDPFARDERRTITYAEQNFTMELGGRRGIVQYAGYILPHQSCFSSVKRFEHYAGPSKWNNQQGLYIYRSDRLIQSGGWSWMRTPDEHTKLARIALYFQPELDAAFELNIAKARVSLPPNLRDQMRPHVESLVKEARQVYDAAGTRCGQNGSEGTIKGSRVGASGSTGDESATSSAPAARLGQAIEAAAAKTRERAGLRRIKAALRRDDAHAARALGW